MNRWWFYCCITFVSFLVPLPATGAELHGSAHWIWDQPARKPNQTLFLRKEFVVSKPILRAEFCVAADFNRSLVFLNGSQRLECENDGPPVRQNVAKWLKPGKNVLAIEGRSSEAPAAVAIHLRLDFADGTQEFLASDESWAVSNKIEAGWLLPDFQPKPAWTKAVSFGRVEHAMLPHPPLDTSVSQLDDYEQWRQALGTSQGTDASKFSTLEGFEIERLRSAGESEGSWISMAFDSKGRLIIGKEERGLLRMTLPKNGQALQVESINDTLLECRGLLWAYDSLYVSANNSKGLYRLRDTDGNDQFDQEELLYQSSGGVGHGRNDLALGPDGKIYLITGDSVELPRGYVDRTSPFREFARGKKTQEGHVLRFNPDGANGEIYAAGLRNPYGIAFDPSGEPFTYDADAEYDVGAPWYRPTRIVHLMSGADYGWRGVTKSWPPYYPDHSDNAPPVLDIGKGSPTSVKFGTRSHFPKPYREALFILDWAYGRVLAVNLTPRGAGFVGRAHVFLKGQPFNVTDLDFGPDGAMYVVTGGRKTQSALYRIRYVGAALAERAATPQQKERAKQAAVAQGLRRELENLHQSESQNAVSKAWPYLNSADPWLRHGARIAIEHQPVSQWRQRALLETQPTAALTALMALARNPTQQESTLILERLTAFPLVALSTSQKQMALNTYATCLTETVALEPRLREKILQELIPLFPDESPAVNRRASELLVKLESPQAVSIILSWLSEVSDQPTQLHGLFLLRNVEQGWTPEQRRDYFAALLRMREFQGGEGMPTFVRRVQADVLAALNESDRQKLNTLLAKSDVQESMPIEQRPFVRAWKLVDLEDSLAKIGRHHRYERGEQVFKSALCVRCHRVGYEGAAIGPDLTSVGRRFSRRDVLQSILSPSIVVAEQYRQVKIVTTEGQVLVGQMIPSSDYRSSALQIATNPLEPYKLVEVAKHKIESHATSLTSVMPADLLNTFTKEDIVELIAWLEAGGNPRHPNFQP